MDGVLVSGSRLIPGADDFITRIKARKSEYLVLTNNPIYTPGDLSHRLRSVGLDVPPSRIFTSAIAAARFLDSQRPDGKAFVIGESGLTDAIHRVGYVITDIEPDYVVPVGCSRPGRASWLPTRTPPDRSRMAWCRPAVPWLP
jgi:NagD protein